MLYTKVGKSMPGMLKPIGEKLQEKGIFNTWMLQEQDLIQAFAKSYADRIICEAFKETMAGKYGAVHPSLEGVLHEVLTLHLLSTIEKDLPTFMEHGLLNPGQGKQVIELSQQMCEDLAPKSLALAEAFGLPEEMLHAPIASDWVAYNAYDNQGELQTRDEFLEVLNK